MIVINNSSCCDDSFVNVIRTVMVCHLRAFRMMP